LFNIITVVFDGPPPPFKCTSVIIFRS